MFETIVHFIPVVFTGLIAYLFYFLSKQVKYTSKYSYNELCWFMQYTPALGSFFVFVLYAALLASKVLRSLTHVSNHIILTLDILYFLSLLLLSLYQIFKDNHFNTEIL